MSFKKDDIIIRDDCVYPRGALVVDGFDSTGRLLAHPLGGGMQLAISPDQISRFTAVSETERTPIFQKGVFELEALDHKFAGWSDGTNWNGWAKPFFEFTEASQVAAALNPPGRYDQADDAFITQLSEDEDCWHGETIALPDGGTARVYGIGAGAWIWEEVEDQ